MHKTAAQSNTAYRRGGNSSFIALYKSLRVEFTGKLELIIDTISSNSNPYPNTLFKHAITFTFCNILREIRVGQE